MGILRKKEDQKWYRDKQNIALLLGFVSTMVTFLNFLISV